MQLTTVQSLIDEHRALKCWTSSFQFKTSTGIVDLLSATGSSGKTRLGESLQPTRYPPGTTYLFDLATYSGVKDAESVLCDVSSSIDGCSMYRRGKRCKSGSVFTVYTLRCSFGQASESYVMNNFSGESFSKVGTIVEPLKQRRRAMATGRMDTHNLRTRKTCVTDDTPDPDDEFVRAEKNRAGGMRALTPSTTCNCVVFLCHYHKSGDWFLGKKSCLTHNNHNRLDPTHKRVRREEISVVESDFAQIIFDQGGTVDCVTRVMNELRKNSGIVGIVQKRTVKHLLQKTRLDIDFILGIKRDWSIARKTIN